MIFFFGGTSEPSRASSKSTFMTLVSLPQRLAVPNGPDAASKRPVEGGLLEVAASRQRWRESERVKNA
jgi:hypothetical protein